MKNLLSLDECQDIMRFTVAKTSKKIEYNFPKYFIKYPPMKINSNKISTFFYERKKEKSKDGYFINNDIYTNPPDFVVRVGSTFLWEFINLCDDDVCLHIHLANFQIVERQKINKDKCKEIYEKNKILKPADIDDVCEGSTIFPQKYERGFKDTLYCPPSYITRIIIRYAPTYIMNEVNVGENYFSFNTSDGPEYIISSQILEQKDNYLVRPQIVLSEE